MNATSDTDARHRLAPGQVSRRDFLGSLTAATAALTLGTPGLAGAAQPSAPLKWPIVAFSKAFQELTFDEAADLAAEVGWNGLECPVRKGGHVESERVEEDLPKMVEALKKRGLAMHLLTSDIQSMATPHAEKVLRTAARLGIRHYRLGMFRYAPDKPIPAQVAEVRAGLRDVVALTKELGMSAGIQNHSGADNLGAPVWDIYEIIKELDPRHLGVHFDIGHATVEGGNAWKINSRLLEPFLKSVYVKDFTWQKGPKGWANKWCPLGEGMISRGFVAGLKKTAFDGPISQHFEYPISTGAERVQLLQKDLATLKAWLGGAA